MITRSAPDLVASIALAGFLAAVCIVPAHAAPPPGAGARAQTLQALSDCRKIATDAERLSCYDRAASALDQAESQGKVVVIDQAQVAAVRRQAFGFHVPSLSSVFARAGSKTDEGVDRLNLVLEGARREGAGRWTFVAADGAVWRQTDDEELAIDPRKGAALLVKSGALGSFFCKVDGQPQVRCERVR